MMVIFSRLLWLKTERNRRLTKEKGFSTTQVTVFKTGSRVMDVTREMPELMV